MVLCGFVRTALCWGGELGGFGGWIRFGRVWKSPDRMGRNEGGGLFTRVGLAKAFFSFFSFCLWFCSLDTQN